MRKVYKLPKGKVTATSVLGEKTVVIYLKLDKSTMSDRLHLGPADNQLNSIQYKKGVPYQATYLAIGEVMGLSGQKIRIFEEVKTSG